MMEKCWNLAGKGCMCEWRPCKRMPKWEIQTYERVCLWTWTEYSLQNEFIPYMCSVHTNQTEIKKNPTLDFKWFMSHPQMSTVICRNRDDYQHQSSWAAEHRTDFMGRICVCVRCVWVSVAPQVKADRLQCLFNLIRGCHPLMSAQWISKRKLHLLPSC